MQLLKHLHFDQLATSPTFLVQFSLLLYYACSAFAYVVISACNNGGIAVQSSIAYTVARIDKKSRVRIRTISITFL